MHDDTYDDDSDSSMDDGGAGLEGDDPLGNKSSRARRGEDNAGFVEMGAGAYTRPLLSSIQAASDTKFTLSTPKYPLAPPKDPLNNFEVHPLCDRKRSR